MIIEIKNNIFFLSQISRVNNILQLIKVIAHLTIIPDQTGTVVAQPQILISLGSSESSLW